MNDVIKDYKKRIDYDLWADAYHVDPDKRPWTYDCEGNKVVKTEDGEPDYTKRWRDDMRTFYSKHYGVDEYANRSASVFKNEEGHWEVDFWLDDKLKETRVMQTDGVYHNETYADNAAENYVLGYMI